VAYSFPPSTTLPRKALWVGIASYALWGFFPVYWKLFRDISAGEILLHRLVWTLPFYLSLLAAGPGLRALAGATRRDWGASALASAVLSLNWGLYVYAVLSNRVVEGSLAYFLNPLLNVAVGVFVFREPFPWPLRLAVGLATAGVALRMAFADTFPWIALTLATSFCLYGVVKKKQSIPPALSSALEGLVGFVPALVLLLFVRSAASVALPLAQWLLCIGAGVVTGLPLFLFSYAAQRVPYSILGILQFVAPTLQFLVGVLLYREPFGRSDVVSFGLIWAGAACYVLERLSRWQAERRRRATLSAR
jgi:chloramphenicol-sensitive protein RarD